MLNFRYSSMGTLVLIRHGLSQWNLENKFTGWTDIPLAPRGAEDAKKVPDVLRDLTFNRAYTSNLQRAQQTLDTILQGLGQTTIPVTKNEALNERHYGDLQGLNKADMIAKYGAEQVQLWRRSFSTRPPNGESIADCVGRVMPYVENEIMPHVFAGETVIIAAHGNSLRPIFRQFDNLDDETTATLDVFLSTPYVYSFEGQTMVGKSMRPVPGIVIKVEPTGELVEQA